MPQELLCSPALTYRQCQLVTLFVFVACRAGQGATRHEMAARLNLSHDGASLRSLAQTLMDYRLMFARRRQDVPRQPLYFYAHREAWQP